MFCPDLGQKRLILLVVLLFVLFAVFFDRKPKRLHLLKGRAVLNLTCHGILPLLQFPIADELSPFILAMDKDDVCPAFDTQNLVFGDFQELCDASDGDAEFLSGLEAAK